MAVSKTSTKNPVTPKASGGNLITMVKLPRGVDISVAGPKSPQLERILKNAGLNPQARCFGGNTCIV